MSMNTLKLSNVVVDEAMQKVLDKEGMQLSAVFDLINPVIHRLATLNPLWTFACVNTRNSTGSTRIATGFSVRLDGEELGQIGISHTYNRGYLISVSNDRIGKNRQRSDAYRTQDADKAVLMAKKMFGKMNPTERIAKAHEAAERVVTRATWNKERERNASTGIMQAAMMEWVSNVAFHTFMEYINKDAPPTIKHKVTTAYEKTKLLNTEMKTIERVQEDFSNSKTALVVKDAGKYLVKIGDDVQLYDDNSLPLDMRMKMGMLKLVQDEEYLSDVGCRVTSEIFVMLVDDLTNVSEGA